VASSLDGYIAGPNGEYDWITQDPDFDFGALFKQFDTLLMGRKSFAAALTQGGDGSWPGMKVHVFSRTLRPADYLAVTVVSSDPIEYIRQLKGQPGKDIWLWGGGELFRTCLEGGVVDSIEVGLVPILLGGGIRLLPDTSTRATLVLKKETAFKTGGMFLEYAIVS
jgi:dihydrofolate reductase